jgi:hypothetical protein
MTRVSETAGGYAEPDGTELFIGGHELAKMRRLIQKVEKYEAKRPSRKR